MHRLVLVALSSVVVVAGCGGDDEQRSGPAAPAPAAAERAPGFAAAAEAAVRDVGAGDAALLDVRTRLEFAADRAAGTLHLPLDRVEAGERPDVAKDRKLYVYCRTGARAAEAVKALRADGYRDVTNIGGLRDWERAGGQVERR